MPARGALFDRRARQDRGPFETVAVAVALWRDLPGRIPEARLRRWIEALVFACDDDAENRRIRRVHGACQCEFGWFDAEIARGHRHGGLAARQPVAVAQPATVKAAELAAQLRAARAEDRGDIDAARDGQVEQGAARDPPDGEDVAFPRRRPRPRQQRTGAERRVCVGSRQREGGFGEEAQAQRRDRDLDPGGAGFVAVEEITGAERDIVIGLPLFTTSIIA